MLCIRSHSLAIFVVLLELTNYVCASGGANHNPTGQGCVDPQGFLDCYQAQVVQASGCLKVANQTCSATTQQYNSCVQSCFGARLAGNIGCWVQSCWNEVYSCEYQATAIEYIAANDLVQSSVIIPFYPAPDGVPGRCSCNLGDVYGNQTFIFNPDPCSNAAATGNKQTLNDCLCCKNSLQLSNILNECPKSDLSYLSINSTIQQAQSLVEDNCAILDKDNGAGCASFNIQNIGSVWYNPVNLPASEPGTEPLSNLPGTPFTVFGDTTFNLALFPGFTSTITPAPYVSSNVAATATGGAIASGTPIEPGTAAGGTSESAAGGTSESAASTAVGGGSAGSSSSTKAGTAGGASTGSGTGTAATPSKTGDSAMRSVSWIMLFGIVTAIVACNLL